MNAFQIDPVLHHNIVNVLNFFEITPRCFFVGGSVRDNLLGLEINDFDIAVECITPQEVRLLTEHLTLTGVDFPVFRFWVQDSFFVEHEIELAVARVERSTGPRHSDFVVEFGENITITDDLFRRDLTINSLAVPVLQLDVLLDPCNGVADLDNKVLRATSDAFREDPLRVFRVARFHAGKFADFRLSDDLVELCREIAPLTQHLVPERIVLETEKVFQSALQPSRFFRFLRDTDNLSIWFPELECLIGVPQPAKHHGNNDAFDHTLEVLDHARIFTKDVVILWAALFHDVGKGLTSPDVLPSHHGHDEAGVAVGHVIADRLILSNVIRVNVIDSIRFHMNIARSLELRASKVIDIVTILRRNNTLHNVIAVAHADRLRKGGLSCNQIRRFHVAEIVLQEKLPRHIVNRLNGLPGLQIKAIVRDFNIEQFKKVDLNL